MGLGPAAIGLFRLLHTESERKLRERASVADEEGRSNALPVDGLRREYPPFRDASISSILAQGAGDPARDDGAFLHAPPILKGTPVLWPVMAPVWDEEGLRSVRVGLFGFRPRSAVGWRFEEPSAAPVPNEKQLAAAKRDGVPLALTSAHGFFHAQPITEIHDGRALIDYQPPLNCTQPAFVLDVPAPPYFPWVIMTSLYGITEVRDFLGGHRSLYGAMRNELPLPGPAWFDPLRPAT